MAFTLPFSDGPVAPANSHDLGDLVRVSAVFSDVETSAALDPGVVNLSVKTPAAVVTTYVYGTDPEIVKDSVGNYHADIDANEAGTWHYRWWSTGNGQAAEEQSYTVVAAEAV